MKLTMENNFTYIVEATDTELDFARNYLSCEHVEYKPGAATSYEFSMLGADGRSFASGLTRLLVLAMRREGMEALVRDERTRPGTPDPHADLTWLRDYQRAAVETAVRGSRGIIRSPTGSGKGEMVVGIARLLPDVEWLFLVHRSSLVKQQAERYEARTGERAGRFEKGVWKRGTGNVTVATFQSVFRALKKTRGPSSSVGELLTHVTGLLVDECHAQSASSFYATAQAFSGAYYRFGFSGTPTDRDDRSTLQVVGALGPVVASIDTQDLIARGVLAKPTIRMIPCYQTKFVPPPPEGSPTEELIYAQVYDELVVRSTPRNELIVEMALAAEKPALIFVDRLEHGQILEQMLAAEGVAVDRVWGKYSVPQREAKIRALVDGRNEVLICNVIFQEGIDAPAITAVINAAAGQSVVANIQRIGRGMRPDAASGKTGCEVWDVLDQGQYWLSNHARRRCEAYEGQGHEVLTEWGDEEKKHPIEK